MSRYILDLQKIDKTKLDLAGGKGANLGELSQIQGLQVPGGFCVTTEVYKEITVNNAKLQAILGLLNVLNANDRKRLGEISAEIRECIDKIAIPNHIADEITQYLGQFDKSCAYAVRSSATAEDLLEASFAGQLDSYLNIVGKHEILRHVRKCWASLYTDRAILYRLQNGFEHSAVKLSVVIQKMIFPEVSGVMFTADPLTANRKLLSIDASFGLGEALVSGLVNPDHYKVSENRITEKKISLKNRAVFASEKGGTKELTIRPERRNVQALTDNEILKLAVLGRKIEAYFDYPQDIEWCLAAGTFYILQSRQITTLYPIPEALDHQQADTGLRIYVSVGHQQMMTDAMKPLGLSFFMMTTPASMYAAGGRLFVDVSKMMASPAKRPMVMDMLGKSDPLIKDALMSISKHPDFIKSLHDSSAGESEEVRMPAGAATAQDTKLTGEAEKIVSNLIQSSRTSVETLKQNIRYKSGADVFDCILEDIQQLKKTLFNPESLNVILVGRDTTLWINEKMNEWLGEKNVADILLQSVLNNVTSEMGLALLDVADVIRPYPDAAGYLKHTKDEHFLDELIKFNGGLAVREAILTYLTKYGMRCPSEIDICRVRWSEKPISLVPLILENINNFETGAAKLKFEKGRQEAAQKEQQLLGRLKQLPDGQRKAEDTKQKIDLLRKVAGYREYPKYSMINRYFIYKQSLLKEAQQLVERKVLHQKEDIYYLTFEELRQVVKTKQLNYITIDTRKEQYKSNQKLKPPRVITSDGEMIEGDYKRETIPAGAMAGLAVSSGVVEGRARVIVNMENVSMQKGDILVTRFTDPGWTPLFLSLKGLVTEVGGLMTHGAVIAREYGLPAVVGVGQATHLIKDGQQIRVNGTEGYVEIL